MGSVVGIRGAQWYDLFHPAPVKKERRWCPTSCCCDNLRGYACQKQFNCSTDAEAMTRNVIHWGLEPDLGDRDEKQVLKHMWPWVISIAEAKEGCGWGGALQLMLRWLRRAATGQKMSEREVMIIRAPSCLVVFVHGMRILADEEPLVRAWNVGVVARVTWCRGLNVVAFFMVISPRRRQPKKVVVATTQTAAWKGSERLRAPWRTCRCSIETGAQRGRLKGVPSLLAKTRAFWTHSWSPCHCAWCIMCQALIPASHERTVPPA